jgi:hypothetical protein
VFLAYTSCVPRGAFTLFLINLFLLIKKKNSCLIHFNYNKPFNYLLGHYINSPQLRVKYVNRRNP